jgi:hypothetical protein
MDYVLEGQGSIPCRRQKKHFMFSRASQTGSGVHPASYPVATGKEGNGISPGVKRPKRESNPSHSSSDEVKNGGAWCLIA